MKILIIGSNGREHALAEAYAKSEKVKKVFIAPGNGLTDFLNKKIINVPILMTDFSELLRFVKKEKIDLVDVAQDDILAAGYVDKFQDLKIPTFGPTQKATQLEWDKEWSRNFMVKYKLPIPHFKSFNNHHKAIEYINKLPDQLLFIKAAGLALGKGVIKVENKEQAKTAVQSMNNFGKSGETFLIEEGLVGEEFSFFTVCDGKNYEIIQAAQDHKTVNNGDQGPNTGGVGCVSPTSVLSKKFIKEIETKIIQPALKGMEKEGRPYKGILYLGGMVTKTGIKIIEFNCRWGDPEAEVIIPSIKTEYITIAQAVIDQKLNKLKIQFDDKIRIAVTGCSRGYPNNYSRVKGKEIFGLNAAIKLPCISIYGSGIERKGKRFFVNGGRIFHVVAEGQTILQARVRAYGAMSMIYIEGNNLHYRTDIGWREVERLVK